MSEREREGEGDCDLNKRIAYNRAHCLPPRLAFVDLVWVTWTELENLSNIFA